jgi:hypothetical protein
MARSKFGPIYTFVFDNCSSTMRILDNKDAIEQDLQQALKVTNENTDKDSSWC